jgi:hypothetical protein
MVRREANQNARVSDALEQVGEDVQFVLAVFPLGSNEKSKGLLHGRAMRGSSLE